MAEVSFGLLLTAAVGIVWSLRDNSNPATLWTWGWAIFAAMALLIRGMSEAAWAPQVSSIFSPLLPAFMLAGALAYANRPAPSWLLPAALAVGATRWLLVRAGLPDASHAVAIVAEPATHLAAAGVLLRATWGPGQKIAQRLLAPTLLAVAAVDTATGLAVARGGVYPPILTAAWAVASLVTLGIQITASGHRGRQLRGALERESDRAREALEASKRRFETLAEYVTDLIMEIDSSGRIAYLSPSARHILGLEVADALGSASLDLVHPDDRARAGEVLQRALSDAYSSEVILRTRHAGDSFIVPRHRLS